MKCVNSLIVNSETIPIKKTCKNRTIIKNRFKKKKKKNKKCGKLAVSKVGSSLDISEINI